MTETMIFHMCDLKVGDRLERSGEDFTCGTVVNVDAERKEIAVEYDDGGFDTFPWDSKRSKGYNKVKAVRDGE